MSCSDANKEATTNTKNKQAANIALVGAGWWSQGWHLPHLLRNSKSNLVAIVDNQAHPQSNLNPDLESLEVLGSKYNCRIFGTLEELLSSPVGPTLDGVLVATPHATHYDIGQVLLEEATRRHQHNERPLHVLMEKPMTTNVHQAMKLHQLVQTYQKAGGKGAFLVNHSANFRTQAKKARQLVVGGDIGNVRFITAFFASPLSWIFEDPSNAGWNEPTEDMEGNGFSWGQCSHLLAWLFHACPTLQPRHVFCAMNHSASTGADVAHAATIVCNNHSSDSDDDTQDVVLSMSGTSLLPGNEHSTPKIGKLVNIKIFGTEGSIVYSGDDSILKSGQLQLRRVSTHGQVETPAGDDFHFESLDPQGDGPESLHNFLDACCGDEDYYQGADSLIGLRTVQVLEAMYRSNATKKSEPVHYV